MSSRRLEDLLWENLREIPAFRSLIRTIEGRLLLEQGPLPPPLLDIGCGDGHFASVFVGSVDVGIDLDLSSLEEASRRGVYRHLEAASACRLPFRDGVFASVLANCALEHIPRLEEALAEIGRVLRPGGLFVLTVPNERHNDNLLLSRLLRSVGLERPAAAYRRWFRTMQVHHHMYPKGVWEALIGAHGLEVTVSRDYLSPRATVLLELGHYAGWHNLVSRKLFGRWVLVPWRPLFAVTERILLPRVAEDGVEGSSCHFLVARKRIPA
jgi:SAM-dependent methyltransferase